MGQRILCTQKQNFSWIRQKMQTHIFIIHEVERVNVFFTASLMIFAWILCAAISSVVGRYFQPYYWGEKLLGSKTWIKVNLH